MIQPPQLITPILLPQPHCSDDAPVIQDHQQTVGVGRFLAPPSQDIHLKKTTGGLMCPKSVGNIQELLLIPGIKIQPVEEPSQDQNIICIPRCRLLLLPACPCLQDPTQPGCFLFSHWSFQSSFPHLDQTLISILNRNSLCPLHPAKDLIPCTKLPMTDGRRP